jgi:hypothetical protein
LLCFEEKKSAYHWDKAAVVALLVASSLPRPGDPGLRRFKLEETFYMRDFYFQYIQTTWCNRTWLILCLFSRVKPIFKKALYWLGEHAYTVAQISLRFLRLLEVVNGDRFEVWKASRSLWKRQRSTELRLTLRSSCMTAQSHRHGSRGRWNRTVVGNGLILIALPVSSIWSGQRRWSARPSFRLWARCCCDWKLCLPWPSWSGPWQPSVLLVLLTFGGSNGTQLAACAGKQIIAIVIIPVCCRPVAFCLPQGYCSEKQGYPQTQRAGYLWTMNFMVFASAGRRVVSLYCTVAEGRQILRLKQVIASTLTNWERNRKDCAWEKKSMFWHFIFLG